MQSFRNLWDTALEDALTGEESVEEVGESVTEIGKSVSEIGKSVTDGKKTFEPAYKEGNESKTNSRWYSLEQVDGIDYVKAEKNIFIKVDGTLASERDVFNYLVGRTISLPDDDVKIVKNLPGKRMYKELYNRQPKKYKGVNNVKQLNSDVNYNMKELLENSDAKLRNVPDEGGRHVGQGIIGFDTRIVKFYDGSKAYNIEFSIANLMNGEKVAYAKKFFGYDAELKKYRPLKRGAGQIPQ